MKGGRNWEQQQSKGGKNWDVICYDQNSAEH